MAVSPLDPQSVRLTIASDMASRLSMLFVVHTQMGGWGDNTAEVVLLKYDRFSHLFHGSLCTWAISECFAFTMALLFEDYSQHTVHENSKQEVCTQLRMLSYTHTHGILGAQRTDETLFGPV